MHKGDGTRLLKPHQIKIDASRFQFRSDANSKGVSGRLKGVSEWSPYYAGIILVYAEWGAEGETFTVVDGHHRVELAQRLEKAGADMSLRCFVIDAKDKTPKEARALGTLANIAAGNADPYDIAAALRNGSIAKADLKTLPKSSTEWRQAGVMAKIDRDVFNFASKLRLDPAFVETIAEEVNGKERQISALQAVSEIRPRDRAHAKHVVTSVTSLGFEYGQSNLFGNQEVMHQMRKRAEVLAMIEKIIRTDKAVFTKLVNERDRIEGAGNVLAADTNEARLVEAKAMVQFIASQCTFPSATSAALKDATLEWIAGKTKKQDAALYVLDTARQELIDGAKLPTPKPITIRA